MQINGFKSYGPTGSPVWTIFSFIAKQPAIIDINWVSRTISFVLAIFVLFVGICHFENVIKSDKMTVYVPHVYRSYEELIDNNVTIYSSGITIHAFLQQYRKYSRIHNEIFWKMINYSKSLPEKDRKDYIAAGEPFIEISNILDNRVALLKTYEAYRTIIPSLCDMLAENNRTDICYYRTIDEEVEKFDSALGHIYSNEFKSNPKFAEYMNLYMISYAMGLTYFKSRHRYEPIPKMSTSDCRLESQYPVTHDPEYLPFEIENYKYALSALLIPVSIAIIVLIWEVVYNLKYEFNIADIRDVIPHHYYPSQYWASMLEPIFEEGNLPAENAGNDQLGARKNTYSITILHKFFRIKNRVGPNIAESS